VFGGKKRVVRELHELPDAAQKKVIGAVMTNTAPHFHGGCVACVVRVGGMNTTIDGLRYCSGCCYLDAEWDLPDKSVKMPLPPGGHSASDVDAMLGRS